MSDCYNTGDVYSIGSNPANGALTAGGLVGKMNGVMERCFNAGDVTATNYAVGGLVGYLHQVMLRIRQS